ncbi:MAG TPA: hypothetical protein P5181_10965 [Dermatophilaceae bacterium]|nr:hypothetical protein [Dermatophilaceae bacterium]
MSLEVDRAALSNQVAQISTEVNTISAEIKKVMTRLEDNDGSIFGTSPAGVEALGIFRKAVTTVRDIMDGSSTGTTYLVTATSTVVHNTDQAEEQATQAIQLAQRAGEQATMANSSFINAPAVKPGSSATTPPVEGM